MKIILSERNIVVILFVLVLITFSLAQEDSKKKMTSMYSGILSEPGSRLLGQNNQSPQNITIGNSASTSRQ